MTDWFDVVHEQVARYTDAELVAAREMLARWMATGEAPASAQMLERAVQDETRYRAAEDATVRGRMIQQLEALAEIRGTVKHLALTLDAVAPRVDTMEEGLSLMVDEFGRVAEFCERPPAPMPADPRQLRYYRAARTATEKARCALVATQADLAALRETLESALDRLTVAAYTVAADLSTTDDEGIDDAAV